MGGWEKEERGRTDSGLEGEKALGAGAKRTSQRNSEGPGPALLAEGLGLTCLVPRMAAFAYSGRLEGGCFA